MRFSEIPGLQETKNQLIQAVLHNHVAHAQLFYGKQGSANLALALAFSTYLNCTDRSETDSCGACSSCMKMDKLIHPDLQFVYPVSSTKNITGKDVVSSSYLKEWRSYLETNIYGGIEDWSAFYGAENKQANISKEESRNIIKGLALTAFEAEFKVLIIWLPEFMHPAAANGILKILEEPPKKTIFLMVTSDYEKLLTTILSRCQLFKVPSFSELEVANFLVEKHAVSSERAKSLALLAEGSIKKALEGINEGEDVSHALFRDWMRQCWTKDFAQLNKSVDTFFKMSKTAQKLFFLYALNMMRHALVSEYMMDEDLKLGTEERGFVTNFGKALNTQKIEYISNELSKAHYHLERNANVRILFMDLSLTIGKAMTA
ncbi:MAG: DNA polymerase III subunit delta [Reichenbachiella sp.]